MIKRKKRLRKLRSILLKAVEEKPDFYIWSVSNLVKEINKHTGHYKVTSKNLSSIFSSFSEYRSFRHFRGRTGNISYIFVKSRHRKKHKD